MAKSKKAMSKQITDNAKKAKWKINRSTGVLHTEINDQLVVIRPSKKGGFILFVNGETVKKHKDPVVLKHFAQGTKPPVEEKAEKTKGKKVKKAKAESNGEKRPGIIQSLFDRVKAASKSEPVTKAELLEHLVEEFPDREPSGMLVTINHFPNWDAWSDYAEKVQKVIVEGRKVGFWMKK